jgi:enoyl-CoA hydratase
MPEVLRERRDHIEILTINRPEARNAVNGAVSRGIGGALDELETDDDCWVVILTGAGDKAFCAGMDLKAFAAGEIADIAGASGGFGGIARRAFPKPIIAALNGSALAGGCEIMLACDLVVSVEEAKIAITEVRRGLIAGAGGLIRLPRRLPRAVALELALTGEPIDARRALALGLINRVVPAGSLMDEALALAEVIAANAPLAVRTTKRVMLEASQVDEDEGWDINNAAMSAVFGSADAMEGSIAFAEKRPPNWTGK